MIKLIGFLGCWGDCIRLYTSVNRYSWYWYWWYLEVCAAAFGSCRCKVEYFLGSAIFTGHIHFDAVQCSSGCSAALSGVIEGKVARLRPVCFVKPNQCVHEMWCVCVWERESEWVNEWERERERELWCIRMWLLHVVIYLRIITINFKCKLSYGLEKKFGMDQDWHFPWQESTGNVPSHWPSDVVTFSMW